MKKLSYRIVKWKVSLPASIAGRVELALANPHGTGPRYGSRSDLVVELLTEWLDERERLEKTALTAGVS